MLEICALASGSNGNCYYIGNENEAVLIDAGIYYKRLLERLETSGLEKSKIKAIFISHEHADHIQGVKGCAKKLNVPVFITEKTFKKTPRRQRPEFATFIEPGMSIPVKNITVRSFLKMHDAVEPCSFTIECDGQVTGVFTDIGEADERLKNELAKCHHIFLETNYDREMLWNGPYPEYLKKRVDSEHGHLSNEQAYELARDYASPQLKTLFLSHISAQNNTVLAAMQVFSKLSDKYRILPTSREGISEVLRL